MKKGFLTFYSEESGSMMPLWAIGGMMVVISFLWVDNTSYAMLEKIKQLNVAGAAARLSLTQGGGSKADLMTLARATGVKDPTALYSFSATVNEKTIKDIDAKENKKRLNQPLEDDFIARMSVDVPFTETNQSIGISPRANFATADRTVKLLRPLDIVIAVENTAANSATVAGATPALMNALTRLYQQAPESRAFFIPYGWRINYGGRCYTGISRGDNFSFVWWEQFYLAEERLRDAKRMLEYARQNLANAESRISSLTSKISQWQKALEQADATSDDILASQEKEKPDYASLIEKAKSDIKNLEMSLPGLQDTIDKSTELVKTRTEAVERLKKTDQYRDYLPLSEHYSKVKENYELLEDYNDTFSNQGKFAITKGNFTSAASRIAAQPNYLYQLSVQRNQYFGSADTCPSMSTRSSMSMPSQVNNALSALNFASERISTLEGLLWAGRTAFTQGRNSRSVIFMFVSSVDDTLEPKENIGAAEACRAIRNTYANHKAARLVIVTADKKGREKFTQLQCPTNWGIQTGYIVLDEMAKKKPTALEEQFLYALTQESTTRDIR